MIEPIQDEWMIVVAVIVLIALVNWIVSDRERPAGKHRYY